MELPAQCAGWVRDGILHRKMKVPGGWHNSECTGQFHRVVVNFEPC